MAKVTWTEPALSDLDAIADYIALDNPSAARELVQRIFAHVEQLAAHPMSGPKPPELRGWRYRQIVEPPLLRSLLRELDGPADANVAKAWLVESQRRYRELIDGSVKAVPGHLVFERLRSRLAG